MSYDTFVSRKRIITTQEYYQDKVNFENIHNSQENILFFDIYFKIILKWYTFLSYNDMIS